MCKNIIINQQSCCDPQSYSNWIYNVNGAYHTMFRDIQYPTIREYYRIIMTFNSACVYPSLYNPYEYNSAQDLTALLDNYTQILNQIQLNEQKFIN
jgi:hypothetical protein